jgi:hypothetical protein
MSASLAPPSIASTGNEAAWNAEANAGPRIALTPIASISAPGLVHYADSVEFTASFTGSGIDFTGFDVRVLGDATVVNLSDVKFQHTGGGHMLITGYDGGGTTAATPS